ncbi:hypothetical protein TW95_gp0500 [Pandoravirus inopinatum]|uniref:Uncharacterized protein n=1 Tax=Pandoravirus inopinatum TaxID=1605721 RepID=A0A0B5J194_9VIRU|nr:hypothetical protein TW95_gp0500 [Pandoravirus inopinatum]AJF97234.1 hypothetical protein [Pandoravirus inopinatum]
MDPPDQLDPARQRRRAGLVRRKRQPDLVCPSVPEDRARRSCNTRVSLRRRHMARRTRPSRNLSPPFSFFVFKRPLFSQRRKPVRPASPTKQGQRPTFQHLVASFLLPFCAGATGRSAVAGLSSFGRPPFFDFLIF